VKWSRRIPSQLAANIGCGAAMFAVFLFICSAIGGVIAAVMICLGGAMLSGGRWLQAIQVSEQGSLAVSLAIAIPIAFWAYTVNRPYRSKGPSSPFLDYPPQTVGHAEDDIIDDEFKS